jgi:hypothetical protein
VACVVSLGVAASAHGPIGVAFPSVHTLNVITESNALTIGLAAALLAFDLLAWHFVAAVFDRERLVTSRHA